MPKPKQFVKENKRKLSKHALQTPETADEYLAAGVDCEEAGEKWRGGDAAKSTRFFLRAIDAYDEGLRNFPNSFDLAYNKARVQYELTQYPRLTAQLPGTLLDLLQTALESSRVALNLRQDNADVLFNTAQVLTSLVEALNDDRSSTASKEDGLQLLQEAIELFQRCLALQEYQHAESQAQEEAVASASQPDVMLNVNTPSSSVARPVEIADSEDSGSPVSQPAQEERWATIVEPVTNDTLLDTVLAQLETLGTLCGLITADEGRGLAWIEEYSTGLLSGKMPAYVKGTDREEEAALTRANFIAALADANFRSQRMDASTYARALEEAFGSLDLSNDPEGLCDRAEALIAYNSALRLQGSDGVDQKSMAGSRWRALTAALELLAAASKLPSADSPARIHLTRGDVELLRYQLSQAPTLYDIAARNASTLLKNAGTFYRGAEGHSIASKLEEEVKESVIKIALAASLAGQGEKLRELMKEEAEACQHVLEDAVDDGLITIEWLIHERIVDR